MVLFCAGGSATFTHKPAIASVSLWSADANVGVLPASFPDMEISFRRNAEDDLFASFTKCVDKNCESEDKVWNPCSTVDFVAANRVAVLGKRTIEFEVHMTSQDEVNYFRYEASIILNGVKCVGVEETPDVSCTRTAKQI